MNLKEVISQLEDLQGHCQEWWDKDDEDSIWERDVQALDVAMEVLEKEISKNVSGLRTKVKALDVETKQVLTYDCAKCPSCGKWLSQVNRYCQYCGQRLDWEVCRE